MNVSKEVHGTVTGQIDESKTYANCRTLNVIYLAMCRCCKQYVGKTTRNVKDRVLEHIACINRTDVSSAITAHIINEHGTNENFVSFQIIETVRLGKRKGDIDKLSMDVIIGDSSTIWVE